MHFLTDQNRCGSVQTHRSIQPENQLLVSNSTFAGDRTIHFRQTQQPNIIVATIFVFAINRVCTMWNAKIQNDLGLQNTRHTTLNE